MRKGQRKTTSETIRALLTRDDGTALLSDLAELLPDTDMTIAICRLKSGHLSMLTSRMTELEALGLLAKATAELSWPEDWEGD